MGTPNKLDDPHKVAAALKAHRGHKRAAADALGVSKQALYQWLKVEPPRIRIDCDYTVIEYQHITTRAVPDTAPHAAERGTEETNS